MGCIYGKKNNKPIDLTYIVIEYNQLKINPSNETYNQTIDQIYWELTNPIHSNGFSSYGSRLLTDIYELEKSPFRTCVLKRLSV
jgi:hypothetical protein